MSGVGSRSGRLGVILSAPLQTASVLLSAGG